MFNTLLCHLQATAVSSERCACNFAQMSTLVRVGCVWLASLVISVIVAEHNAGAVETSTKFIPSTNPFERSPKPPTFPSSYEVIGQPHMCILCCTRGIWRRVHSVSVSLHVTMLSTMQARFLLYRSVGDPHRVSVAVKSDAVRLVELNLLTAALLVCGRHHGHLSSPKNRCCKGCSTVLAKTCTPAVHTPHCVSCVHVCRWSTPSACHT